MKKSAILMTIASVLFVSSLVSADDAHHLQQSQQGPSSASHILI